MAVDGFGGTVAGTGQVEVGQDVAGAAGQRAAEAAQRVDHRPQLMLPAVAVLVAVSGEDALIDHPDGLDLDMVVDVEDGIDAGALQVGRDPWPVWRARRTP